MKVLIDENLPHELRHHLEPHDAYTVAYLGWNGRTNGNLLRKAASENFDALITRMTASRINPILQRCRLRSSFFRPKAIGSSTCYRLSRDCFARWMNQDLVRSHVFDDPPAGTPPGRTSLPMTSRSDLHNHCGRSASASVGTIAFGQRVVASGTGESMLPVSSTWNDRARMLPRRASPDSRASSIHFWPLSSAVVQFVGQVRLQVAQVTNVATERRVHLP